MDSRIEWALEHMHRHIGAPLTVAALARAVNLSASRFAHLFRSEVGVPPARHLHALRLARARVLLERTFLPVHTVMRAVGYSDPSHFGRDFRRAHGASPATLRGRLVTPGRTRRSSQPAGERDA